MDGAIWRDDLAVVMLAAWCNVRPDQMPDAMRAHTCAATAEAWGRVAAATRDYLTTEARVTVAGRSMTVAELIAAHERAETVMVSALESAARLGSALNFIAGVEPVPAERLRDIARKALERDAIARSRSGAVDTPPAPTETEGA